MRVSTDTRELFSVLSLLDLLDSKYLDTESDRGPASRTLNSEFSHTGLGVVPPPSPHARLNTPP